MLSQIFESLRQLFDLVGELQRLRAELLETQTEMRLMNERNEAAARDLRDVAYELRRLENDERHEREKLLLRLENEMLKFERRLPPPRNERDP